MDICELLSGLDLKKDHILTHDVHIIIESFESHSLLLDVSRLKVESGMYKCTKTLYEIILRILIQRGYNAYLLDMMPYIDEYLDYCSNL
jgi:hypothetical protein